MMVVTVLAVLIFGFCFFEAAGYAIHRLLHWKRLGSFYRAHQAHHVEHYPPTDYLSKVYRKVNGFSTIWLFLPFVLPAAALMLWLLPLWLAIPLLVELAFVGWLNDYMHDSLHIDGHRLERVAYFRLLRLRHFQHHVDMTTNYGIVTFFLDRLTGTFKR
jgi:sterol desaturase/sphingolipid hydroxylase (fatty acid hydroxylase superfamily)